MISETQSADGTSLVYRRTGPADGRPLVLLHGWSADLRCWSPVAAELARRYRVIAVDLRGHGYSDAPLDGYDDSRRWAADVAAVLAAEQVTAGAVLLGWSYGGLVLTDYVSVYGTGALAGIGYVGAITGVGRAVPGGQAGAAMQHAIPGVFEERPGRAVRAFAGFGDASTGSGPDNGTYAQALFGASLATPPRVRKALFYRTVDHDPTLRALDVPALIVHGLADPVVDIAAARHNAELIPDVRTSYWADTKHAPFVHDPARFVAELHAFVDSLG